MALGIDAAGFLLEAFGYHGVDAPVDAVEEFGPLPADGYLDDAERALLAVAGEQGGSGDSGLEGDFDGVDEAAVV